MFADTINIILISMFFFLKNMPFSIFYTINKENTEFFYIGTETSRAEPGEG